MNKVIKTVIAVSFGLICLSGCMPAGATPENEEEVELVQTQAPKEGQEMAVVTTNMGVIKFVLYEDLAPKTVKQFKALVEEGFYDGKTVFSAQKDAATFITGASNEEGTEGKIISDDGKGIEPEVSKEIWHFSGAVSAFGTEEGFLTKKVLADSRFFMVGHKEADAETIEQMEDYSYSENVINAYKELGGIPLSTGRYTVFGQVVEGMDVVDAIVNTDTQLDDTGKETVMPVDTITIEKIELSTYSSETVSSEDSAA